MGLVVIDQVTVIKSLEHFKEVTNSNKIVSNKQLIVQSSEVTNRFRGGCRS